MTTLFISYSSKEKEWALEVGRALNNRGYHVFVDLDPDDGIHAGAKWEQILWQRLRQSRGVVVLCTANWLGSPWCVAEAMIARERGKPVFLLAAPEVIDNGQVKNPHTTSDTFRIPDFLKDTQFIPVLGLTPEEMCRRLEDGLAKEGLRDDFPLPERPYPGFEPFQEKDAAVFFGRDDEIATVMNVINRRQRNNAKGFILILGASGSGKSSLVRAGVLPRLRQKARHGDFPGSWVIPSPFTGRRGLDGLSISLANAFRAAGQSSKLPSICRRLETVVRAAEGGSKRAAENLRKIADDLLVACGFTEGFVLLVLDQLEEVFDSSEGSRARSMLRLLLEASGDLASQVVILATLRSDFLDAFQQFPGIAERYEEITLDPMPRSRFGELIEKPAERFGLRIEAGLTERLVEDTRYDDALPLLTFTLDKLYESCAAAGALKLQAYEELFPPVSTLAENGSTIVYRGVSAAIKHAADQILSDEGYAGLSADDLRMRDLRRAFYSLTRVGEGGLFTRRSARWRNLPDSCKKLLNKFVSLRLLVMATEDGEP